MTQSAHALQSTVRVHARITLGQLAHTSPGSRALTPCASTVTDRLCDIAAQAASALDQIDAPKGAPDLDVIGRALEAIWNMADDLRARIHGAE